MTGKQPAASKAYGRGWSPMEENQHSRLSWMSWLLGGFLGLLMPGASLADDGPIVCIDLQTSSTPDPSTITATYTGSGPTVYAFLVVTEIPGDYVSAISAGFELATDGSVTNTGFTILEDWEESSAAAYGFDPQPTGSGELVPAVIGYWTLELSEGISSTATLSLVAPGDGNGDVVLVVDGERRGLAAAEVKHGGINASAPTTSTNDPLHEYLPVRQHHVLMQFLGQNLVIPEGLVGAPLETFTEIDSTLRAAFLPYEPVRIDKVFPGSNAGADSILVMSDGYRLSMPKLWNIVKITVGDTTYVQPLIDDLLETEAVRFAQVHGRAEPSATPDDTRYPDQWHLENDGEGMCIATSCLEDTDIDASGAWDITVGSSDVIVAIVDSGIRRSHEDLRGRIIIGDIGHGLDCVPDDSLSKGHGTHIAGALAATTDNGIGVSGVDWEGTLMNQCVSYDEVAVARGIRQATDGGANVLNLSLAWAPAANPNNPDHQEPECVRQATLDAFFRGVQPVAAAGNQFFNVEPRYPAAYPHVLGVGNVDCCDNARQSPHNGWLNVMAPGTDIWTTDYADTGYVKVDGTSLSCPIAAGITSLLLSVDRGLDRPFHDVDTHRILELTAVDLGDPGYDNIYAWGRANARSALEYATSNLILNDLTVPETQVDQFGSASSWVEVQWDFPPDPYPPGTYVCRRYEMRSEEVEFPIGFSEVPDVWVRLGRTVGLDDASYQQYDFPWGEVIDTTETTCVLRTYVYEVQIGEFSNAWWPATREDVRFAFTAAGPVDPSAVGEDEAASEEHMRLRVSAGTREVRFLLPEVRPGKSRLSIYDASGRLVRRLLDGNSNIDTDVVLWDTKTSNGDQAPSGVYFARWEVDSVTTTNARFVLVR